MQSHHDRRISLSLVRWCSLLRAAVCRVTSSSEMSPSSCTSKLGRTLTLFGNSAFAPGGLRRRTDSDLLRCPLFKGMKRIGNSLLWGRAGPSRLLRFCSLIRLRGLFARSPEQERGLLLDQSVAEGRSDCKQQELNRRCLFGRMSGNSDLPSIGHLYHWKCQTGQFERSLSLAAMFSRHQTKLD